MKATVVLDYIILVILKNEPLALEYCPLLSKIIAVTCLVNTKEAMVLSSHNQTYIVC